MLLPAGRQSADQMAERGQPKGPNPARNRQQNRRNHRSESQRNRPQFLHMFAANHENHLTQQIVARRMSLLKHCHLTNAVQPGCCAKALRAPGKLAIANLPNCQQNQGQNSQRHWRKALSCQYRTAR